MAVFVAIGIVLSLAGLAGIVWCIRRAARLKGAEGAGMSDDAVRAELGRLVFVHTAAVGAAFLGLGLLIVGLLLQ